MCKAVVIGRFIWIIIEFNPMQFKITKWQFLLVVIGGLIVAVLGGKFSPTFYCIRAPCPQPKLLFAIVGGLIGVVITYVILLIFNNIKKE